MGASAPCEWPCEAGNGPTQGAHARHALRCCMHARALAPAMAGRTTGRLTPCMRMRCMCWEGAALPLCLVTLPGWGLRDINQ